MKNLKKILSNQKGQVISEYVIISAALIVGFALMGVLGDEALPNYEDLIENVFFNIRLPL